MLPSDTPILLVDDDVVMLQTTQKILNGAGYKNIQTANNGEEALTMIKAVLNTEKMYKIIFLDWDMPKMDGLAFLKICRGDLALKDIAIIMLTSFTDQKSLILALGSGATSFMTKPVAAEALLNKVEQISNWIDA
ncbi:MAG: response regulator [Bdellovibrionales bacterium]|jgi:two-component system chemotaxis response regulator CheY